MYIYMNFYTLYIIGYIFHTMIFCTYSIDTTVIYLKPFRYEVNDSKIVLTSFGQRLQVQNRTIAYVSDGELLPLGSAVYFEHNFVVGANAFQADQALAINESTLMIALPVAEQSLERLLYRFLFGRGFYILGITSNRLEPQLYKY